MKELKRYFSYLGKYKGIYFMILGLTLAIKSALDILYSYMNKLFFNSVEYGEEKLFVRAAVLCVVLVLCRCLFPYLRYFSIRLVRKIVFEMKISLFQKLMKLNMKYYEQHHSGEALKTLNWDANSLKDSYFSHVYWVAGKVVDGITSMVAMCIYSPLLAVVSIGFSMITVWVSLWMNRQIKAMEKKIQGRLAMLAERLSDILSGFTLLKMYSGATIVLDSYDRENRAVWDLEKSKVQKEAGLEMVSFLLGILGNFGTILVGAFLVARGTMDYGTVMAVVSLQMGVSTMMQRLGSSMTTLSASLVKAGRVFDFLELDCEELGNGAVQNGAENDAEQRGTKSERTMVDRRNEEAGIRFENVSFSYERHRTILHNFNMIVAENEKILLMGESGCGKSTLLKLLLGFYEKDSGEISLYGRAIEDYSLKQLRELITYIPQNNYLFEGTIGENIAMGSSGEVSEAEIRQAARLAYAEEFIEKLPDGYDTRLTAGGTNLSGGQRQRIAIARAFLKNSPILLMDEPSSALDAESEKRIHLALKQLMREKIVLMVTHRDADFAEFDRVVRL